MGTCLKWFPTAVRLCFCSSGVYFIDDGSTAQSCILFKEHCGLHDACGELSISNVVFSQTSDWIGLRSAAHKKVGPR